MWNALSVAMGKATRWGLHNVLGRNASQLPGRVALAVDPRVVARQGKRLGGGSIVVCGTNGKTTTTNLVANALETDGMRVVCNRDGANMLAGVTTALLDARRADWAVLEVDELSCAHVLPRLKPTYLLLLNLFRDQLDRTGEIDRVQDTLVDALASSRSTTLVVCADDPFAMNVADRIQGLGMRVVTFGMAEDLRLPPDRVPEGRFCQRCGNELVYEWHSYAQLGKYSCCRCGFARPSLDFEAADVRVGATDVRLSFVQRGKEAHALCMGYGGAYMAYNLLAVATIATLIGVSASTLQRAIAGFRPHNGRLQRFVVDGRDVVLNLAKNPAGLNQNIAMLLRDDRPKTVFVVVNDESNDGRDVSWIWDVDFERLAGKSDNVAVLAGGHRANDVQVRLKYAGMHAVIAGSVSEAVEAVASTPVEHPLYVLANYSALRPAREELERLEAHYG